MFIASIEKKSSQLNPDYVFAYLRNMLSPNSVIYCGQINYSKVLIKVYMDMEQRTLFILWYYEWKFWHIFWESNEYICDFRSKHFPLNLEFSVGSNQGKKVENYPTYQWVLVIVHEYLNFSDRQLPLFSKPIFSKINHHMKNTGRWDHCLQGKHNI